MGMMDPGSVVWFEVDTTDPQAVKDFYGSLLGWTFQTVPTPDGRTYTLISADGAPLPMGGFWEPAPGVGEGFVLAVRSADVDADIARLKDHGADVVSAAGPAADGGRSARLTDPRGTHFSIWQSPTQPPAADAQPDAAPGAPVPGSLGWFEIGTADIETSKTFYANAFGWTYIHDTGVASRTYFAAVTPGDTMGSGGLADTGTSDGARDYAAPQFLTPDVPAAVARATQLGATVESGPETTAYGLTHARLTDPRGNRFLLFTPPPMPPQG
ncbi:VOC family protein [Streptosporangium nondiastaticum]|uniref:VOC family protein n=1 Tax=Streptosporangium nondiastaticum TaxID=35764 RepID=A0A9X7PGM3_9ACTN|nr:VOC family protein [Streptosporangium nondiastaticum]PSJ27112.1 VOC family protein [Streptosporangium nondiastaticum]